MSSSHVDSDDGAPPPKRQRCTKKKDNAWNVQHVCELVSQQCACQSGTGGCLRQFVGDVTKVVGLRAKLKSMPPGECDLTVVNMLHGSSQLDLSDVDDDASSNNRVSDSDCESDGPPDLVESSDDECEGRVDDSDGHIDSGSGSDKHVPRQPASSSRKRPRKGRYEHKLMGKNVCRRALLKLLGCAHPAGVGKLRKGGGRRLHLSA